MDSKETRRSMLETLKKIRDGLNKQVVVERRRTSNNVVSFPGTQNMNPNYQQANPNNGMDFNQGMPSNVVPLPGNQDMNPNYQQTATGNSAGMGHMKSMGSLPGIPNMSDDQLPRAGFASGLVLAGITFVTELLFLAVSYFMFK